MTTEQVGATNKSTKENFLYLFSDCYKIKNPEYTVKIED